MSAPKPLVSLDDTRMGDAGTRVLVQCHEPQPCMNAALYGPSANVLWATEQLERLHQAQHAVNVPPGPIQGA